ncbi:hypothetical protein NA57DRAFT_15237, partial [Rhizodiscina lignyota]
SDLPRLRYVHTTAGYRDGVSASKASFVQEGFDEGFALGAEAGLRVGAVLGVLEGIISAIQPARMSRRVVLRKLLHEAEADLSLQNVFGREYVDEDGIWKWDVRARDEKEDVTFRDIADSHPLIVKWKDIARSLAQDWGLGDDVF